jgi:hypothetical protein
MPHTTNRTHSPSHSPCSDDENTPPQSLDGGPNQGERGANRTESCDRVWSQENEALRRKLADIYNHNDDENIETPGMGTTHWSKCQKTRNPTLPTGSDDEAQDDTSTGTFVSNMGHNLCVIYEPGVYKGANIFKIKFHDTYDATERFKDDNKFQGLLQKSSAFSKRSLARKSSFLRSGCAARHENLFFSD